MLVLSRRVGECIVINDNVTVKVVSVQGNKITLGITAPESVRVDRQEVYERRGQFAAGPNGAPAGPAKRTALPLRASLRRRLRDAMAGERPSLRRRAPVELPGEGDPTLEYSADQPVVGPTRRQ